MFATLFFIAISFGFFMLGNVYGGIFYSIASENTAYLVTLTCDIICTVVCVPLLFGYVALCIRLVRGEEVTLSEMFSPYSSLSKLAGVYAFFIKTIPALVLKLILPLLALTFLYSELDYFIEQYFSAELVIVADGIRILYFIPAILIIIACMLLFGKNIYSFLCFCSENTNQSKKISRSFAFLKLRLSLIPLYALSFLTFGILFIVYTIPITAIIYSLFFGFDDESMSEHRCEDTTQIFNLPFNEKLQSENNGITAVFDKLDSENN